MSKTLKDLRIEAGLTLQEVAGRIGCATSGPASWEGGRYGPAPRQIPKLAELFGVTPEIVRLAVAESRRLAQERHSPAAPAGA